MKKFLVVALVFSVAALIFADGMPGSVNPRPAPSQASQPTQPAQATQAAEPAQPTPEQNFFAAVRRGDVTAARGFLDSGAVNVNAKEPNTGMNALMIATDRVDLPMVIALIRYRPDPQARDNQNRTVGQIAAGKANPQLSATLANAGY